MYVSKRASTRGACSRCTDNMTRRTAAKESGRSSPRTRYGVSSSSACRSWAVPRNKTGSATSFPTSACAPADACAPLLPRAATPSAATAAAALARTTWRGRRRSGGGGAACTQMAERPAVASQSVWSRQRVLRPVMTCRADTQAPASRDALRTENKPPTRSTPPSTKHKSPSRRLAACTPSGSEAAVVNRRVPPPRGAGGTGEAWAACRLARRRATLCRAALNRASISGSCHSSRWPGSALCVSACVPRRVRVRRAPSRVPSLCWPWARYLPGPDAGRLQVSRWAHALGSSL